LVIVLFVGLCSINKAIIGFAVEQYIAEIHRHNRANCEGVYTIPTGAHIRDDEQVSISMI
jgi:hypothetical protein